MSVLAFAAAKDTHGNMLFGKCKAIIGHGSFRLKIEL